MTDLAEKHCVPCEGGVQPFDTDAADRHLRQFAPEWRLADNGKKIQRDFKFKGFNRTMGFVNAIAWIANTEGHHPDMQVGYNHCLVYFSTHAIGGLSENDFICAAKVDKLLDK